MVAEPGAESLIEANARVQTFRSRINAASPGPVHQRLRRNRCANAIKKQRPARPARPAPPSAIATRDDLLRLVGDVDEREVLDILGVTPFRSPKSKRWRCALRATAMFSPRADIR